jgi:type IX secretion system substrate protein/cohesin domain-containing protein
MIDFLKTFFLNRFCAKMFCALLFGLASALTAQTASVFIQPGEHNINVDSSVIVTVSISDVIDLHSYSITIPYDGSLVEITDVIELDFLSSHSTLFFPNINAAQNSLLVDCAILGTNTQNGSGNLFEIEFYASGSGDVNLILQNIILRDSQNNDIPFTSSGGIIRISPVTDVKENVLNEVKKNIVSNYPNPFNNATIISYYSNYGKRIEFKVFSMLGKEVYSKIDESMIVGEHKFYWNGKNNFGTELSSGIYLITINEGNNILTKKITLLK